MSFCAEDRLMLLCARGRLDQAALTAATHLLGQQLDWDYLLEASIQQGVAPLLAHGLQQVAWHGGAATVPPAPWAELQRLYQHNRVRNARLCTAIGQIFTALDEAGIGALALKELQLLVEGYPDPSLRPVGDIDILVRRDDYARAAACLARLGFLPVAGPDRPYAAKYAWGGHFRRAADDLWVDLQWNVLQIEWDAAGDGRFDFAIERLWRRAQPVVIAGRPLLAPGLEDLLFHLCLHLEGHAYAELVLFCDIAELLRHAGDRLDWAEVVRLARTYGVTASCYSVLLLVQQLLQAPVPDWVLGELTPNRFAGPLLQSLFAHLTLLHVGLDELHRVCPAQPALLADFERTVRSEAIQTMQLDQLCAELAEGFAAAGGSVLLMEAAPSAMLVPDPALKAPRQLTIGVLAGELATLERTLVLAGFVAGDRPGAGFTLVRRFTPRDPALGGQPLLLTCQTILVNDPGKVLNPPTAVGSTASAAIRSLGRRLRGDGLANDGPVTILLYALPAEMLLLAYAVRFGRQPSERLWRLASLIDFLRHCPTPIDWVAARHLADCYGVRRELAEGLAAAAQVLPDHCPPMAEQQGPVVAPPLLAWGRYGPSDLTQYTALKRAYYFVLGWWSVAGRWAKWRYVLRAFWSQGATGPILPAIVGDLVRSVRLCRRRTQTPRHLAYWAGPLPTQPLFAEDLPVRKRALRPGTKGWAL